MKIAIYNSEDRMDINSHPIQLLSIPNFSGLQATIQSVATSQDGAYFLGSKYNVRDIEFEGYIDCYGKSRIWIQEQRETLYRIMNPKEEVTVEITTDDDEIYTMNAHPVSFPSFPTTQDKSNEDFQTFLLQLEASDPYLYKNKKIIALQQVVPMFSFPMSFNSVSMGEVQQTLIVNIFNDGINEAPVEITITASQPVTNPYLLNVYTGEQLKINCTMATGDQVFVDTGRKKEISKISNGIKTPFYYALDLDSDFIQLNKGNNIFRFGADSGEDFMRISVGYKERRAGL